MPTIISSRLVDRRSGSESTDSYGGTASAYHMGRAVGALMGALILAGAGLVLSWTPGLFLALPALGAGFLAFSQVRHTTMSPELALGIDTILLALVVAFARPPAVLTLGPITVLAMAGMLLVTWWRATAIFAAGVLVAASGLFFDSPFEVSLTQTEITVLAVLIGATYLPGFYVFLRRGNETLGERGEFYAELSRQIHYQRAMASCSQALLSSDGDIPSLDSALEILLDVLQVDAVVMARNVLDEEGRLCREVRRVVKRAGGSPVVLGKKRMPWDLASGIAKKLASGETYFYPSDAHTDEERQLFVDVGIASDMIIPIEVNGEWDGYLSFTDTRRTAEWDAVDLSVLPSIARMIGAYWTRTDTQERLQAVIDAKDEFVASVSHELRTPLTAVVGFTEELRESLESRSTKETFEIIEVVAEQARDVANIVEDLLVVTRLDSDSLVLAPEDVPIAEEIHKVVRVAGMSIGVVLDDSEPSSATVDPGRFRQIIHNLFTNAIRYGGPTVRCSIETHGDVVRVVVTDDGPGIPEELWEQVFQPYQRSHTSAINPSSVGLGLTVSRRLARLMGGNLTYRYEAGLSTFELTVPKATSDQPASPDVAAYRHGT